MESKAKSCENEITNNISDNIHYNILLVGGVGWGSILKLVNEIILL